MGVSNAPDHDDNRYRAHGYRDTLTPFGPVGLGPVKADTSKSRQNGAEGGARREAPSNLSGTAI